MAKEAGSAWFVGLATALTLSAPACGSSETQQAPVDAFADAKRALLAAVATDAILDVYRDFEGAAGTLVAATSAYATSLSADDRAAAQAAWSAAIDLWQAAEVVQIGPAGPMSSVAGGADLREQIYSWPLVNACRVDQETVEAVYDQPGFGDEPVNVRGLDALEYLLFNGDTGNACGASSLINTDGSWAALGDAVVAQRRADYAAALATLVEGHAAALVSAWDPAQGNYTAQLAGAGLDSARYATAQEALNALTDAMFYVEKDTKDMKLAEPAGITLSAGTAACASTTCPDALESRYAARSKDHILANVRAFRRLWVGGDDSGFDALLAAVGRAELGSNVTSRIDIAIAAIEAIPGTLRDAIDSAPAAVSTAFDALSDAMLLFKTEVLGVLDLEIPLRADGDND